MTPPPRRAWCSDECVERYQIAKGDQGAARRFCWKRDRGICAICRTDTVTRPDEKLELQRFDQDPEYRERCTGDREGLHLWPRGEWDADHETPIAEGGALAPENLRTLCTPCHKAETAALRRRLARGARA